MAFDPEVAQRVRAVIQRRKGITEKKMFGGVAFMLDGHMCCGVLKDELVVRLGEEGAAAALREKHTRYMDFTGKPLKTMVYVAPKGFASEDDLRSWVDRAVRFARTLPPK